MPVACRTRVAHDSLQNLPRASHKRGIFSSGRCMLGSGNLHGGNLHQLQLNASSANCLIVQMVVCRLQMWRVERIRGP